MKLAIEVSARKYGEQEPTNVKNTGKERGEKTVLRSP
jgi:hypothetical protein